MGRRTSQNSPQGPHSTACSLLGCFGPGPEFSLFPLEACGDAQCREKQLELGEADSPGLSALTATGKHGLDKPCPDSAGATVFLKTTALGKDTMKV